MRLFERAVQKQLVAYLGDHSVLCKQQSGFRRLHSTQTGTLDVKDFILSSMDEGKFTGAVYIDLKKAFDTVDCDTLLFKLQCLGIRGTAYKWFKSYMTDRSQSVQHGTISSEKLPVSCGVPQGSILGPILFSLYVNDIVSCVKSSKIVLYADDTVLLSSGKTAEEIKTSLISDLASLDVWFLKNKLHLNTKKCKWTLFGSEKRLQSTSVPAIHIKNETLEHVTTYKYLGVQLDKNLNFDTHIDDMCKKVRQRLGVLRRVRDYLDEDTALMLYNALVMPVIDYCDVTYATCTSKNLNRIEKLMAKGGRIILNERNDYPSASVFKRLKWLTFRERSLYHKNILMFKCLHAMCPQYLSSVFEKIDHGYNTRQSDDLKVVKCHTNMGKRSFKCDGANSWNILPSHVQLSSSLDVFKRSLLKHILTLRS